MKSVRCDAILALGKQLVEELKLDQSCDTLGRWMAHHIAELIHRVADSSIEDRADKMRECSDAIMGLWKYRYEFTNSKWQSEEIAPLIRTLESLDPENDVPRYSQRAWSKVVDSEENNSTKFWLELVDSLDYSAKVLIRYCLSESVKNVLDNSENWISLAEAAGAKESVDTLAIRVFFKERLLLENCDPENEERTQINERISQLEKFITLATSLSAKLKEMPHSAESDPK